MTTLIEVPEAVNHEALRQGLTVIRTEIMGRQEDVHALRERAAEVADALEHLIGQLTELEVDPGTITAIEDVRESAGVQADSATKYTATIDAAAHQADAAWNTAERNHGAIADAVADADVPLAKPVFYETD
jgi:hypothetical protein